MAVHLVSGDEGGTAFRISNSAFAPQARKHGIRMLVFDQPMLEFPRRSGYVISI